MPATGNNAAPKSPPFMVSVSISSDVPSNASKYAHTLPTMYRDARSCIHMTSENLEAFFQEEFDVKRLNKVHQHLWLAGRSMPARSLHRQVMMNRKIVVTEQADLHLTWNESQMFLKPFPSFLLKHAAWKDYLCTNQDLFEKALGFLISYTWLVCSESDFSIAMAEGDRPALLPRGLQWTEWRALVEEVLKDVDVIAPKAVNQRYQYGELRLGRLNLIYRLYPAFKFRYLIRGYYYGYHQYQVFFQRNFTWLIVVFAYVTIILSAMQVGLSTKELRDDNIFNSASYGFAAFSILVPVIAVGLILLLFVVLGLDNLSATVQHRRAQRLRCKASGTA